MGWIIEGTIKYEADTGSGEIVTRGNNFRIFTEVDPHKGKRYTWTQTEPFKEPFSGIGNVLSVLTDALDQDYLPKKGDAN